VPIDIGARYVALFEGDVDVANVFSTDPQLASGDFRLLEDPERLFGYQHVALVIDEDKLETLGGDEFMDVINAVNRQLSQRTIIDLNAAVDLDNRDAADVAGQFLRQRGLVEAEAE
jgi:osmoprotectant transport system substrate-binding protein